MRAGIRYGFWLSLLLVIVIFWSCETGSDEPYKDHFISYYEGDGNSEAKDLLVNDDGTIVMVGTSTEVSGIKKVHLVKTDAEGKIIWSKRFGSILGETASDIELIKSGTYTGDILLLSNVKKNASDSTLVKVRRIDQDGNKIDSIVYNRYAWQFGYSVTATSDGGFAFTGNCDTAAVSPEPGVLPFEDQSDLLVAKYSESRVRNPNWLPSRGESVVMGIKIFESGRSPNPYFIAGYTNIRDNSPDAESNFWFAELSSLGFAAPEIYPTSPTNDEYMTAIARSPFGNYMAIGIQENNSGVNKLFGLMVDQSFLNNIGVQGGNVIEGAPDVAESVSIAGSEKGSTIFWVLANDVSAAGRRDIWVAKVNASNMSTEFKMKFGAANNDDTGAALAELPNGDLLILGTMEIVNQKKMALIRVKSNGRF